jgi:bacterioferritin
MASTSGSFTVDITTIRDRARSHIERGAVTDSYAADIDTVVRLLNEALATEIVCWLRYKRHASMASRLGGIAGEAVRGELDRHAMEELGHADRIAERIVQLGSEPNYNPDGLKTRSHSEYVPGDTLHQMLTEDLIAERIAIETYGEIIRYLSNRDITSRRIMEDILAVEEEHADEVADWLHRISTKDEG